MSKVELKGKTILVTGVAVFIGSNLVKRLFNDVEDVTVIGIDNINDWFPILSTLPYMYYFSSLSLNPSLKDWV